MLRETLIPAPAPAPTTMLSREPLPRGGVPPPALAATAVALLAVADMRIASELPYAYVAAEGGKPWAWGEALPLLAVVGGCVW